MTDDLAARVEAKRVENNSNWYNRTLRKQTRKFLVAMAAHFKVVENPEAKDRSILITLLAQWRPEIETLHDYLWEHGKR